MKNLRYIALTILGAIAISAAVITLASEGGAVDSIVSAAPTPQKVKTTSISGKRDLKLINGEFDGKPLTVTNAEWKKVLSQDEFYVLRREGTERAYTGVLTDNKEKGTYHCAACGLALFSSEHKYDSETGWPSFFQPMFKKNVTEKPETKPGDDRTEIECSRCGSHLGHVFEDGPEPTGLRYCMNSVALKFNGSN